MKRKRVVEDRVNESMQHGQGNSNVPYSPDEIAREAAICREERSAVIRLPATATDGRATSCRDTSTLTRFTHDLRDLALKP